MPVNTSSSTKQYAGDGTQTTFPFTFPISGEGDLIVRERVDATGVTTTKTLTTHYTVVKSGANFDDGGNVEMGTAPASGVTLLVKRATTQTQGTDLTYGGPHDSEAYEDMVDKNTRMIQEMQAQLDRCIKIPDTDDDTLVTEIENSVARASQYAGYDANGRPISAATFAAYGVATAYIQTLLDDADAATAQTTLGLSAFIKTLINDADAATARTTLGAVGLTGNETVAGNKTLSGTTVMGALNGTGWPSFSVNLGTTDQETITGADLIEWSTEVFDTNSDFTTGATARFTPSVAGKYLLSAQLFFFNAVAGDYVNIYLYKNGALVHEMAAEIITGASKELRSLTVVVDANGSTDYFQIFAENDTRNTSHVSGDIERSFWTGCRIA